MSNKIKGLQRGRRAYDMPGMGIPNRKGKQMMGGYFHPSLAKRIRKVAKAQRSNNRVVLEQLVVRGLPELEKFYGIEPEEPPAAQSPRG